MAESAPVRVAPRPGAAATSATAQG
jgi:hypothetical protein